MIDKQASLYATYLLFLQKIIVKQERTLMNALQKQSNTNKTNKQRQNHKLVTDSSRGHLGLTCEYSLLATPSS